MNIETYVIEGDDMRLSLMIWRRFRRPMPGLVERVLDLNPGLSEKGALLPSGTVVSIPIDVPASVPELRVVKLWD